MALARLGVSATVPSMQRRYAWLWDREMDADDFDAILSGRRPSSLSQRQWALIRLLEFAPYAEIRRLLPRDFFVAQWETLRSRMRSSSRREGMAFLYDRYRQAIPTHG